MRRIYIKIQMLRNRKLGFPELWREGKREDVAVSGLRQRMLKE